MANKESIGLLGRSRRENGLSPLVKISNLAKDFLEGDYDRVVFEDLSLDIFPGEFIALLGRSGSGKSTLLNLISGIDLPARGEVIVKDEYVNRLSEHQRTLFRRRNIGFIFQFFNLIPTLTVEENVLLPLELNKQLDSSSRQHVRELLEQVDLWERRESYPDRLSGGEQQRVAIVRALVHKPLILLADEPTGNLDVETGQQVMELLQQLVLRQGMTLLLVTHSMELAVHADRVLMLKDGRLVER